MPARADSAGRLTFNPEPAEYRFSAARLLAQLPPIYAVTIAVVGGDALGNFGFQLPLWIAIALGIAACAGFLAAHMKAVATTRDAGVGAPFGELFGMIAALLAIAAAATIPASRMLHPPHGPDSLHRFADAATVTVRGRIVRAPEHPGRGRIYLYIDTELAGLSPLEMKPAAGTVRVTIIGHERFAIGDELRATGRLRFPRDDGNPGEFNYRNYLLRKGIAATMFAGGERGRPPAVTIVGYRPFFPYSEIERVRDRIGDFIDANLSGDARAEMRALVIGDRGGISEPLRQRFALTGMAHLLVISGLHLGFVAAAAFFMVRLLMGFLPTLMARGYANKFAALAAAIAVTAYASIAGHHVSTIRALIMVLAYTFAIVIDRSREVLASLALAALIICLVLPGSSADIGFQLSFASVIVIIVGMRRFTRWWRWRYEPLGHADGARPPRLVAAEWIAGYFAVSFWALLGTAPLTAYHFNQFSLVGLVANAVVVPVMGFGATICGLAAAVMSFIYVPLACEILLLAARFADAGTYLAGWFERWPLAWTRIFTPTMLEVALAYGFVMMWLLLPLAGTRSCSDDAFAVEPPDADAARSRWRRGAGRLRWRAATLALLIAVLIGDAGWWIYQRYLDPNLRVTFLSVGEGDAAVVRFPGSRVMLVDGGGAFFGSFDPGEQIVAPYLWSNKIMHVDYIALSHPDRDHFGGLIFIARNFSPSQFWDSGVSSTDSSYGELLDAIRQAGARTRTVDADTPPLVIGGVMLRFLGPPPGDVEAKHNNSSMVLRLTYRKASFLFSGDIEAKGERELIASGADLHAAVLKVPHHGSATSSTAEFVAAVDPRAAVISLGYHNRFHFPAAEVIDRYDAAGAEVLRTDDAGAVMADDTASGLRMWTFRGATVALPPVKAGAMKAR